MGVIVAFSGLDGSGKTTQAMLLKQYCEDNNIKAKYVHLKEIDFSQYRKEILIETRNFSKKNSLKGKREIDGISKAIIFREKVLKEIEADSEENDIVIVDRYRDAIACYLMLEGCYFEKLEMIFEEVQKPMVDILLDISPKISFDRIINRGECTAYENMEKLEKSYHFYHTRKTNFFIVDATENQDVIAKKIAEKVMERYCERALLMEV